MNSVPCMKRQFEIGTTVIGPDYEEFDRLIPSTTHINRPNRCLKGLIFNKSCPYNAATPLALIDEAYLKLPDVIMAGIATVTVTARSGSPPPFLYSVFSPSDTVKSKSFTRNGEG